MSIKGSSEPVLTLFRRHRDAFAATVIALIALVICVVSLFVFDGVMAILSCLLGWAMLAIAVEDARHFIIPDYLSLPAVPLGLLVTGLLSSHGHAYQAVLWHLLAALVAVAGLLIIRQAYRRLRGFEGLGLGDVKLAAAAAAWTGLEGFSIVLMMACTMALVVLLAMRLVFATNVTRRTALPFGAFLAPAIWLTWTMQQLPT